MSGGNKRCEDIPFCVVSYREEPHRYCSNSKQRLWQGIRRAERAEKKDFS